MAEQATVTQQAQPQPVAPQPPQTSPEEQKRMQEFANLVTELLRDSQELAFELATIDCDKAKTCPICTKARELVRTVKKIVSLSKR